MCSIKSFFLILWYNIFLKHSYCNVQLFRTKFSNCCCCCYSGCNSFCQRVTWSTASRAMLASTATLAFATAQRTEPTASKFAPSRKNKNSLVFVLHQLRLESVWYKSNYWATPKTLLSLRFVYITAKTWHFCIRPAGFIKLIFSL